jgi:hypothetical protein
MAFRQGKGRTLRLLVLAQNIFRCHSQNGGLCVGWATCVAHQNIKIFAVVIPKMVGKRADRSSLKSKIVPPAYPPYQARQIEEWWVKTKRVKYNGSGE